MDEKAFYSSRRWKAVRAAILKRDGYLCVSCRRYGRIRPAQTVHHIKHLDTHPELAFTLSNLESLCNACHNAKHPEKGGRRWSPRSAQKF